jgi:predicted AAA+ superfamily ATPase
MIRTDDLMARQEAQEKLRNWLKDEPSNLMLVTGPRGYGKTKLVEAVAEETP